jgi:hypothetical protein
MNPLAFEKKYGTRDFNEHGGAARAVARRAVRLSK